MKDKERTIEEIKKLFSVGVHEIVSIAKDIEVLRVPNGFIYYRYIENGESSSISITTNFISIKNIEKELSNWIKKEVIDDLISGRNLQGIDYSLSSKDIEPGFIGKKPLIKKSKNKKS